MRIKEVQLQGFRNIDFTQIQMHDGINIIYGENAQGKTNLIEALWLFTGAKGFRGGRESELIQKGKDHAHLCMVFEGEGRTQEMELALGQGRRTYLVNGIQRKSGMETAGCFYAVVFSPAHLSMIKDGPQQRRKFIDSTLCQLSPSYLRALYEYKKAMLQRNALLRDVRFSSDLLEMLDIYDITLARLGNSIFIRRQQFLKGLMEHACATYRGISSQTEELSYQYQISGGLLERAEENIYLDMLRQRRQSDLQTGTTSIGPHRDDVDFFVNTMSLRKYGSQGQQRSCVLSLKLAESAIIKEATQEMPVILLDDVMSELDQKRKDFLLNRINGQQVFITCCDPSYFSALQDGRVFLARKGAFFQENPQERQETP